jgi:hypothetical protein
MAEREIVFLVQEDPGGGFTAHALGEAIFTQAESLQELQSMAEDATLCHFGDAAGFTVRLRPV